MPLIDIKTLLSTSGTGTDVNGTWFEVARYEFPLGILLSGAGASDHLIVNATDQNPLPANNVHDAQIGDYTSDQVVSIAAPVFGLKVRTGATKSQSSAARVVLRGDRS